MSEDLTGSSRALGAIHDALRGAPVRFAEDEYDKLNLELSRKERNDLGNAERLLARYNGRMMFVRGVGWMCWNGQCWDECGAEEAVKKYAHETARSIMEEVAAAQKEGRASDEELEKMMKWAVMSGNDDKTRKMISQATPYVSVDPNALDADPMILNLQNGTLRLEGACDELRPHDRVDLLSKMMDVEFDPDATCPQFEAFLHKVQPDEDIRMFLQVWFGYCLTGKTVEQKLVFNYGGGSNGKSVLVDLVAKIMGPYSVSIPFSSLVKDDRKRGGEATPDLARLPGARLVRASEPEAGAKFAEATIKMITGGEEITVRRLHHDFFDFVPNFKITISGNHKPQIRGGDHGIWRRFLLVPWEVTIPDEDKDLELGDKLWAERSGVLNWLLDGARMWLERGLNVPKIISAATDEYQAESDPVKQFTEDCVIKTTGSNVQAKEMYRAYERWCRANSVRVFSSTAFGRRMTELRYEKMKTGVLYYVGVALVNLPDDATDDVPPPPESEADYG